MKYEFVAGDEIVIAPGRSLKRIRAIAAIAALGVTHGQLAASGYRSQLAASGDYSQLAASGYRSQLAASGKNSIAVAVANGCIAKAGEGGCIALCWTDGNARPRLAVAYVGENGIKADVFYSVDPCGNFVEIAS